MEQWVASRRTDRIVWSMNHAGQDGYGAGRGDHREEPRARKQLSGELAADRAHCLYRRKEKKAHGDHAAQPKRTKSDMDDAKDGK